MSDSAGRILYANPAARAALGAAAESPGAAVTDVLDGLRGAVARPEPLPGGLHAWYLSRDEVASLADARFAIEVGDALAGTLNLRRTLARIVHLAVPVLGSWAAVTLFDSDQARQVSRSATGAALDRSIPLQRVDDATRLTLRRLAGSLRVVTEPADAEHLCALGASAEVAAELCAGGPVPVVLAPLRAHGHSFGALAVAAGTRPPATEAAVDALARRAAVAVSAARIYEERSTLAGTLRSALLPPPIPEIPGVNLGSAYRPAQETTEIGGDFYEVRRDGDRWDFTLGDVCGKGVEAAILTGQVRQSLRTVSLVSDDPAERLRLLNSAMISTDGTSFVTVVHGVVAPSGDGLTVDIVAGGHPAPLLRRASGQVQVAATHGSIIGMLTDVHFSPARLALGPGDMMLCYTDGITDAHGPRGFLGSEALCRLLADCSGMTAQATCERVLQVAIEHLDGRPHDDMALIAFQAMGA